MFLSYYNDPAKRTFKVEQGFRFFSIFRLQFHPSLPQFFARAFLEQH